MRLMVFCHVQAPKGSPANVWSQLPYYLTQDALDRQYWPFRPGYQAVEGVNEYAVQKAISQAISKATEELYWQQGELHREQEKLHRQLGTMQELVREQQEELSKLRADTAVKAEQLQAATQQQTPR